MSAATLGAGTQAGSKAGSKATGCSPIVVQSPFRWASTLAKESATQEQAFQSRVDTELATIRAQGGIVKYTAAEIAQFEADCARYGAKIETLITADAADAGTAATEGATLLTGISSDIGGLISFFQWASSIPGAATKLLPIIAALQTINTVLTGLIGVSGTIASVAADTTTTTNAISSGNAATVQKSASQVITDVQNGLQAAVAGGMLPGKTAAGINSTLQKGFLIAASAADAAPAQTTLGKITVNAVQPRVQATAVQRSVVSV